MFCPKRFVLLFCKNRKKEIQANLKISPLGETAEFYCCILLLLFQNIVEINCPLKCYGKVWRALHNYSTLEEQRSSSNLIAFKEKFFQILLFDTVSLDVSLKYFNGCILVHTTLSYSHLVHQQGRNSIFPCVVVYSLVEVVFCSKYLKINKKVAISLEKQVYQGQKGQSVRKVC